jgi:hypothetical protein
MAANRKPAGRVVEPARDEGPVARLKRAAAEARSLKRRIEAAQQHEMSPVLRHPTRRGR